MPPKGRWARRSIAIFRMVLRAALADAVDAGDLRRSPAARVAMPRVVAKPDRSREVRAWDEAALAAFLDAIVGHRWEVPVRLSALYGLRRSELLGLHWSALDLKKGTVRIEQASPGNFDQTLARLVAKAGVPRLTAQHPATHRPALGSCRRHRSCWAMATVAVRARGRPRPGRAGVIRRHATTEAPTCDVWRDHPLVAVAILVRS